MIATIAVCNNEVNEAGATRVTPYSLILLESTPGPVGERKNSELKNRNNSHCRDDSECPTWFTCSISNKCVCGKQSSDAVV